MRSLPPPPLPSKGAMLSSSPSRAEKLPAPRFARLARGKSGRRNRGRNSLSRSSPLFGSRSHSVGRTSASSLDASVGDDPSSPKVTCIGQVRIRKKKRKKGAGSDGSDSYPKNKDGGKSKFRCWYLKRALLCSKFTGQRRDFAAPRRSFWRGWPRWLRFERNAGYRQRKGSANTVGSPLQIMGEKGLGKVVSDSEDEVESASESGEETRVFVPPKNALILMRCRSAPHNRCSALAAYPISVSAPEEECDSEEDEENGRGVGSGSSGGGNREEEEEERCPSSKPLFLKRCKSEPARKAVRLASTAADVDGGGEKRRSDL